MMLTEKFRRVHCDPARTLACNGRSDPNRALGSLLTLAAVFCLLLIAGCAPTPTITPTVRAQTGLPRPDRVLVNDFEIANADSELDPDQVSTGRPRTEEEMRVGRAAAQVLTGSLIEELKSRGIDAQRASTAAPPEMNTISIRGRFLWRDKDPGAMRARVWFYQGSGVNSRLVAQTDADIPSDSNRATAVIGSSAYTAAQEADARRMARELAERIARYYREQGWINS